jgi:hypothetical protein
MEEGERFQWRLSSWNYLRHYETDELIQGWVSIRLPEHPSHRPANSRVTRPTEVWILCAMAYTFWC